MHAALRARKLVGERLRAGGQRIGIGHFEHGGHAAEHGRARSGLQVFLVNKPRLAKMHLGIDDSRKDMQAAAIDPLARRSAAQSADLGDSPVADPDVAQANAVLVDHGSIDQDAIETGRHIGSFLQWRKTGVFEGVRPCKRNRRGSERQESECEHRIDPG